MIIQAEKEQVQSNVEFEKIGFQVAAESVHLIIKLVADMYPRPIKTMMTEYVQNAIDSHRAKGVSDRPIEITLPNILEPTFKVRDFGVSMTDDQVRSIYSKVGLSTKSDSKDDIGGFGIGKLCFAAYKGVMQLTTWKHGFKTVWFCRLKDGEGEISQLVKVKSDEEEGVEVCISVEKGDIYTIVDEAKSLYRYMEPTPIIKGVSDFKIKPVEKFREGNGWFFESKSHDDEALVGGIRFALASNEIPSALVHRGLRLIFGPSEVDIVPSRDSLKYTEKTCNAIKGKIEEVKKDFVEFFSQPKRDFEDFYSAISFKSFYYDSLYAFSRFLSLAQERFPRVCAMGVFIPDLYFRPKYLNDWAEEICVFRSTRGRRHGIKHRSGYGLDLALPSDKREVILIENDITCAKLSKKNKTRVLSYMKDKKEIASYLLIKPKDRDSILKFFGIEDFDLKLSDLPLKIATKTQSKTNKEKVSVLNKLEGDSYLKEPAEIDHKNDSGYYLVSHFGKTTICSRDYRVDGRNIQRALSLLGVNEVYLVKKSEVSKLGDGFKNLSEEALEIAMKKLETLSPHWRYLSFAEGQGNDALRFIIGSVKGIPCCEEIKKIQDAPKEKVRQMKLLSKEFCISDNGSLYREEIRGLISKKYPMLEFVFGDYLYDRNKEKILDYIKLIDKLNNNKEEE